MLSRPPPLVLRIVIYLAESEYEYLVGGPPNFYSAVNLIMKKISSVKQEATGYVCSHLDKKSFFSTPEVSRAERALWVT